MRKSPSRTLRRAPNRVRGGCREGHRPLRARPLTKQTLSLLRLYGAAQSPLSCQFSTNSLSLRLKSNVSCSGHSFGSSFSGEGFRGREKIRRTHVLFSCGPEGGGGAEASSHEAATPEERRALGAAPPSTAVATRAARRLRTASPEVTQPEVTQPEKGAGAGHGPGGGAAATGGNPVSLETVTGPADERDPGAPPPPRGPAAPGRGAGTSARSRRAGERPCGRGGGRVGGARFRRRVAGLGERRRGVSGLGETGAPRENPQPRT